MKYLLDTNICVFLLRGGRSVFQAIRSVGEENCYISEITKLELLYGAQKALSLGRQKAYEATVAFINAANIVPISSSIDFFCSEKVRLESLGTKIEDFDLLIAGTAVCEGMTMITDNIAHLGRVSGIRIENWAKAQESL